MCIDDHHSSLHRKKKELLAQPLYFLFTYTHILKPVVKQYNLEISKSDQTIAFKHNL